MCAGFLGTARVDVGRSRTGPSEELWGEGGPASGPTRGDGDCPLCCALTSHWMHAAPRKWGSLQPRALRRKGAHHGAVSGQHSGCWESEADGTPAPLPPRAQGCSWTPVSSVFLGPAPCLPPASSHPALVLPAPGARLPPVPLSLGSWAQSVSEHRELSNRGGGWDSPLHLLVLRTQTSGSGAELTHFALANEAGLVTVLSAGGWRIAFHGPSPARRAGLPHLDSAVFHLRSTFVFTCP